MKQKPKNENASPHDWRAEATRLRAIIDSVMDAIISVDEQQRVILFNPAAERIFRCEAGEALGSPLDRFIPARFRERHREDVRRFGQTGVTSRSMNSPGVLSGLRGDGEEFPIEATISQVEIGGERIFTVILRDITERQRQVEQLERQRETIRAMSTPVLRLHQGLLVLPLVGPLDPERARQLTQQMLDSIRLERAKAVVMDITGVPTLDADTANRLIQTADAARLLGARVILTGVSKQIADTLVSIGVSFGKIRTTGDLQSGIDEANQVLGYRVVHHPPDERPLRA